MVLGTKHTFDTGWSTTPHLAQMANEESEELKADRNTYE